MSPPLRILIADDHPLFRGGLRALLESISDTEVVGEAATGEEAVNAARSLMPDVVVMDINMPGLNGIDATRRIVEETNHVNVLVMTMHEESLYAERALRAGARGYVMKHEGLTQIISAIRAVLNNELFLSESMKEMMLDRLVNKRRGDDSMFAIDSLTDREMEVFQLIGTGFSTRQIASTLNLSSKTVDSHRDHLKLKLRLDSGAELVRTAVQWMKTEHVK